MASAVSQNIVFCVNTTSDPIDVVSSLLTTTPPNLTKAKEVLRTFLRSSPYAEAWRLFVTAHEISSDQPLPDSIHNEWIPLVGMDAAAARLYTAVSRHIASPQRLQQIMSSVQQQQAANNVAAVTAAAQQMRYQALAKAKLYLEIALVTPMDEMEELLRAYEPIAGAIAESLNTSGQQQYSASNNNNNNTSNVTLLTGNGARGIGTTMTPQLKRRYEAAKAIFEYEGPWPERHHSFEHMGNLHVRKWSVTLQKMFSTYVCLATINGEQASFSSASTSNTVTIPKPFPSTVQHVLSLLSPDEVAHLRNTQKRRIQLAMRQALHQCPNEDILIIHYCAFVAAVRNSTEEAKIALMAHIESAKKRASFTTESSRPAFLISPALAAMAVALNKVESASDLFELLASAVKKSSSSESTGDSDSGKTKLNFITSTVSTIAQSSNVLDLNIVSNQKRLRKICNEAKDSETELSRWHIFAEWLEVECNAVDTRGVSAVIAEKGFERLKMDASNYEGKSVDALTLFAHRAHRLFHTQGKPEQGQLIAEVLVNHLARQTDEIVMTGTDKTKTGRLIPSSNVNTVREACHLMNINENDEARRYSLGRRPPSESISLLNVAIQHNVGLGPSLPLFTPEEARWAQIVDDAAEASLRYADDTGKMAPNTMRLRYQRCTQAMPWGLAAIEDSISNEPMKPLPPTKEVATSNADDGNVCAGNELVHQSGWAPFTPPQNPLMKEGLVNPESDEIRAPFEIRGSSNRALTVDMRTRIRIEREEAYRQAEGVKKTNLFENLPSMVARLLKRIPRTTDGCSRLGDADVSWVIAHAFTNVRLDWDSFVEANQKNSSASQ